MTKADDTQLNKNLSFCQKHQSLMVVVLNLVIAEALPNINI